jgi:hypothetical protein
MNRDATGVAAVTRRREKVITAPFTDFASSAFSASASVMAFVPVSAHSKSTGSCRPPPHFGDAREA